MKNPFHRRHKNLAILKRQIPQITINFVKKIRPKIQIIMAFLKKIPVV